MMAVNRAGVAAVLFIGLFALAHISEVAAKDCGRNAFTPLAPCLGAITGNKPQTPTPQCCTAVKNADLDCLCDAFTKSNKPPAGFKPNIPAALALPKKCKRTIPKGYQCNGIKLG